MADDTPVTQVEEESLQKILAFFCDHLVALGGTYIALDVHGCVRGDERFFALPGFIMIVRGVWCLVTAGHSIQELEDGLSASKYRLTNCRLAAHYGSKATAEQTIPFEFQSSGKFSVNDDAAGLDFALLMLTEEQKMWLAENGIRPISEENWNRQRVDTCKMFALLGLPHCLVSDRDHLVPYRDGVAGTINLALAPVQRIELPPDEMPESRYPWFVGVVGASAGLPDIQGMSGGPIFGLFNDADGRWQYWIVALQSRWNEERRIIFACPIPVIAQVIEQELRRYAEAQTF